MIRRLLLVVALLVLTSHAEAAIAFGAAASAKTTGTSTSLTGPSLSPSGSNLIMWCQVTTGAGRTVTVKWHAGAQTFTSVGSAENNGYHGELFVLINPDAVTSTPDVTLDAAQLIDEGCGWYTGAKQSGVPESAASTATSTGGAQSLSKSTVADNAWMMCGYSGSVNVNPTINSGTFTMRTTTNNANGGDQMGLADSGNVTPAGSTTCDIQAGGTSFNITVMASFAPAVAVTARPCIIGGGLICGDDLEADVSPLVATRAAMQ